MKADKRHQIVPSRCHLSTTVWLPEPGSACYRNCSEHLQRIIDKMCMERLLRKGAAHLMLDLDAALHRVAELRGFTLTPKTMTP